MNFHSLQPSSPNVYYVLIKIFTFLLQATFSIFEDSENCDPSHLHQHSRRTRPGLSAAAHNRVPSSAIAGPSSHLQAPHPPHRQQPQIPSRDLPVIPRYVQSNNWFLFSVHSLVTSQLFLAFSGKKTLQNFIHWPSTLFFLTSTL